MTRLMFLLTAVSWITSVRAVWTTGGFLGAVIVGDDWTQSLMLTVEHVGVAALAWVALDLARDTRQAGRHGHS